MTLIFGGAYMGKRDYAKEHCGVTAIEECGDGMPAFDAGCVAGLERFSLQCAREGRHAAAELEARRENWQDALLIVRDIACGVVPLDPVDRTLREALGRAQCALAERAECVVYITCGIGQVIRGELK